MFCKLLDNLRLFVYFNINALTKEIYIYILLKIYSDMKIDKKKIIVVIKIL